MRVSLPELVWVIDKGMQSFKKIYSVIMKLNRYFVLHFFTNDLYLVAIIGGQVTARLLTTHYQIYDQTKFHMVKGIDNAVKGIDNAFGHMG